MSPLSFDRGDHLRVGFRSTGWQTADLWLAAVALGGNLGMGDVMSITAGRRAPTPGEYRVLAAALDDHFREVGGLAP